MSYWIGGRNPNSKRKSCPIPWGQKLLHADPLRPALCTSSSACSSVSFITSLIKKLVNLSHFLSSVSHASMLIESNEGLVGTSDLQPVGQKHRWQPNRGAVLWDWGTRCYLQGDGVRTELKLSDTQSVSTENWRTAWQCWKTHTQDVVSAI